MTEYDTITIQRSGEGWVIRASGPETREDPLRLAGSKTWSADDTETALKGARILMEDME